ncbi:MAG: DUF1947 domain-containing protein [Candidatus Helarchaeota archaeon]
MKLKNRHFLRSDEIKRLKKEISDKFGEDSIIKILPKNSKVEIAELEDFFPIYIINNKIMLFRKNSQLIPSLKALRNNILDLPEIIVDMGAIKYVVNGADVMRPGIVEINDNIKEGSYVKIIEMSFKRPLAIGIALYDANVIKSMKKGKVIKNIHYINDKIWKFLENSSKI